MIITPSNTLISQYQFATSDPREFKHPALIGGFGSGKTESIPLRWLNLIEWRAKHQKVRCKLMVVEPSKEMIRDILVPTFDLFFDRHGIKHSYHKTYHNYTIRYRGYNFTCLFRSSDNPASLTGKTLTDVIQDEFDKTHSIRDQRDIWKECISRIRGAEYGTVSPVTTPEGFKYTYELYGQELKKGFKLIKAKTYDNFFLPKDYVENLYTQFNKELVLQYIEAEFINLTQGRVCYPFERKRFLKPLQIDNTPIRLSFDFNVNPMTTQIFQIGSYSDGLDKYQNEVVKFIKTINTQNTNTDNQCKILSEFLKDYNNSLIIYGDASNDRRANANQTNWEIIKGYFPNAEYRVPNSNPNVLNSINEFNSKMLNSKEEIGIIINNKDCEPLVKDLEQVVYKEGKNEIDKTNPELTHNFDSARYPVSYEYPLIKKLITSYRNAI